MKTYEEMAQNALDRIEIQTNARNARRKTALKIALPAVSLCLVAVLGFGAYRAGLLPKATPESPAPAGPSAAAPKLDEPRAAAPAEVDLPQTRDEPSEPEKVAGSTGDLSQATGFGDPSPVGQPAASEPAFPLGDPGGIPAESYIDPSAERPYTPPADMPIPREITSPTDVPTVQITDDMPVVSLPTTIDCSLIYWKNRFNVYAPLAEALEKDNGGVLKVLAMYRPATADITDFTYEGETLSEIAIAAAEERMLPDRMMQLLKCGDELKYGAALYETGNPSGEKWDKRFYEDRIAFFGEELLSKYIVDGVFLREALEQDLAHEETAAREKYERAFDAYIDTVLGEVEAQLTALNIPCQRTIHSNGLLLSVTAEQLENLPLDKSWYFTLAQLENQPVFDASYPALAE